ncbi:MAG: hypothetical protein HQK84_04785 [Nitrospinae bacterium]|nr:hypothetical protein [Nitrospinota bacterium]
MENHLNRSSIVFLFFLTIGALLYVSALEAPFYLDDTRIATQFMGGKTFLASTINPVDIFLYWPTRFLPFLSHSLNIYFGGEEVIFFRIINILLHVLNSFIIFLALKILLSFLRIEKNIPLFALSVSLLFLVHPLQTQPVIYIYQRIELLAFFFQILTIFLFLKYLHEGKKVHYFIAVLTCLLAVLSKETSIVLPFTLLFIFSITQKHLKAKETIVLFAPFFTTILFYPLVLFGLGFNDLIHDSTNWEVTPSPFEYFLTESHAIIRYIQLFFFPVEQVFIYDLKKIESIDIHTAANIAIIFFFLYGIIYFYTRNKLISFALFFYFASLSITSSFIPIKHLIFEHRAYGANVGLCLLLVYFIFQFRFKKSFIVLFCLFFSVLTIERGKLWVNKEEFWLKNYKYAPYQLNVVMEIANSYKWNKKYKEAEKYYEKVISTHNTDVTDNDFFYHQAHMGLAQISQKIYDDDVALKHYLIALESQSDPETIFLSAFKVGEIYANKQDFDRAEIFFEETIRQLTVNERKVPALKARTYNQLAIVKIMQANLPAAVNHFMSGIKTYPTDLGFEGVVEVLLILKRPSEAKQFALMGIKEFPLSRYLNETINNNHWQ